MALRLVGLALAVLALYNTAEATLEGKQLLELIDGEELLAAEKAVVADFKLFITKFDKQYRDPEEMLQRFSNFNATYHRVKQENLLAGNEIRFTDLNKFADWSATERKTLAPIDMNSPEFKKLWEKLPRVTSVNTTRGMALWKRRGGSGWSIDWRKNGVVTPVKDQMSCAACWAFSAAAVAESHLAISNSERPVRLSEQELVDCEGADARGWDCKDGWHPVMAFEYMMKNGLSHEGDYPYENKTGVCRAFPNRNNRTYARFKPHRLDNDTVAADWLAANGPFVIMMLTPDGLGDDNGPGIFDPTRKDCIEAHGGHAMAVVGMDEKQVDGRRIPYWLVKNSWGVDSGDHGYVKVRVGVPPECGTRFVGLESVLSKGG